MHEFGIADDLLSAAQADAQRAGGRPVVIGVRLGAGGVDEAALTASFEALVEHRGLDISLVVEAAPDAGACDCGAAMEVDGPLAMCPSCGSLRRVPAGGSGLEITFLEITADGV